MKKYLAMLMILITLFTFTSCNTDSVYHTVTIDYDIDWLPEFKITVKEGETFAQPKDPELEGWAFGGWKNEYGDSFDFSKPISSDVTVYAAWFLKNSTIILKDTSGNLIKKEIAKYGSVYTLPTNLGYTIASCVDDDGNSYTSSVKVTKANIVLTITKGIYTEYKIGDIGPGGGYILYDAKNPGEIGNDMTTSMGIGSGTGEELGWRYIEVAGEDLKNKYAFGYYRASDDGENSYINADDDAHKKIGSGKANTAQLIEKMGTEAYLFESGGDKGVYAALAAATYEGGGYSDWFLPSANEASTILHNRVDEDKYKITRGSKYWTSTEKGNSVVHSVDYNTGTGGYSSNRSEEYLVRPFRSF